MNWPAAIANSIWAASGLPAWKKFRQALRQPAKAQGNLLRGLLTSNRDCAYGRAHAFSEIAGYEDFRRCVPLVDYENLAPWIARICRGESRVLTTERVTHLIPTSGSTGARKLIPFTPGLQREFNRAIEPWIVDLALEYPKILFGPAYWSITPVTKTSEDEPSAVPIGFADDASYLGGVKSWLVRAAMAVPSKLNGVADLDELRFRTLLCLLRQRDLRLISIWHPSFLTLLLDAMPRYWNKILSELHREGNRRVRELERVSPGQPDKIWPHLRVISCWGDGHAELILADLRCRLPKALVQGKGLLATEAFVSIPFGGMRPVAVRSHFYEFIDEHGRIRLVHELRKDAAYEVVVTTAGGLWRYRTRDCVRVTGFVGETPSLQFIGKSGNISDLFGEKLSEPFVAKTIQETLTACGATPQFLFLAPDEDAAGWRYTLYAEGWLPSEFAKIIDQRLRQNQHYAYCRDLGQLLPIRVYSIRQGGYEGYVGRLTSEGKRLGEIKPALLCRASGWSNVFSGAYVEAMQNLHDDHALL